jgi:hypothetical protein
LRQHQPQCGEHRQQQRGHPDDAAIAHHHARHQVEVERNRNRQWRHASEQQPRRYAHQRLADLLRADLPVVGRRRHDQCRRHRNQRGGQQVQALFVRRQRGVEALAEDHDQLETEQHLDARQHDPAFLQQVGDRLGQGQGLGLGRIRRGHGASGSESASYHHGTWWRVTGASGRDAIIAA